MKITKIVLAACLVVLLVAAPAAAQTRSQSEHTLRNRISVSYGDALYTTMAFGFFDAFIGGMVFQNVDDINCGGSVWLGYRHLSENGRWTFGGDLGYFGITEKKKDGTSDTFGLFTAMAATECYYLKSGIVRLYGSLGVGGTFSSGGSGFAFQFNPIALRVGNDRIAGFAEVGVGMKGIFNLGLSVGF